ncbi:M10 family metallopeptidase C-terminal domain-containing protein [Synechococcus sp. MIT S1220]|uniref:M10 family metallopeptidase C-terminal domain-containing protein n=1 Tax=Synechococcus sp. MIT S1220 TaxID=3082549 RepID=UPI0039B07C61
MSRRSNEFRDAGDFGQNAHPWTQLSYVDKGAKNGLVPSSVQSYGFLQTPGALDTAALQWLYGINDSTESGANVYRLPTRNKTGTGWRSIWDTGGVDRIDGSKARQPVRIDLRNASLDRSDDAGGYPSRMDGIFGGFTIAHDWDGKTLDEPASLCVIENATGGKSDDILIGNNVSNVLRGRRGDDILYAGGGDRNRSIGGRGKDQFWIEADDQSLVIIKDFSKRNDQLVFDAEAKAIDLQDQGKNTDIVFDGSIIARLKNVTGLIKDDHMMFSDFNAL